MNCGRNGAQAVWEVMVDGDAWVGREAGEFSEDNWTWQLPEGVPRVCGEGFGNPEGVWDRVRLYLKGVDWGVVRVCRTGVDGVACSSKPFIFSCMVSIWAWSFKLFCCRSKNAIMVSSGSSPKLYDPFEATGDGARTLKADGSSVIL